MVDPGFLKGGQLLVKTPAQIELKTTKKKINVLQCIITTFSNITIVTKVFDPTALLKSLDLTALLEYFNDSNQFQRGLFVDPLDPPLPCQPQ